MTKLNDVSKRDSGRRTYFVIKRGFDIIFSLLCLIILSPVLIVTPLLIKLEDGGSAIFVHERVGIGGERIFIYKFRSMVQNSKNFEWKLSIEQRLQYQSEYKISNDPRVTRIGQVLRKTSIDELPQLINILKGEMSVVGPRPIIRRELDMYTPFEQEKLLSVKPGLTGYWQAYARSKATYKSGIRQKMEMHYIEHASILFDIKILYHTVFAVIRQDGVIE